MSTVTIPDGVVVGVSEGDPLAGSRSTEYTFDLLNRSGYKIGQLDGVTGGNLDWTSDANVKGAGQITVDAAQNVNWLQVRVRPVLWVNDLPGQNLGVYIPASPSSQWDEAGGTRTVELLDRCSILDQDQVTATYSLAAGANVVTAVTSLITGAGEPASSITATANTATTASPITMAVGTSKLEIANALLAAAGCVPLYCDFNGQFRIELDRAANTRPSVYDFVDGDNSIYLPSHNVDQDYYSVPNRVIATIAGSGTLEGFFGVATNTDPASPYSYTNRGRYITLMLDPIEYTTGSDPQTVVNNAAAAALTKNTPAKNITLQHGPVPGLFLGDVVRFRRTAAGIDGKFSVSTTGINFDPTALASSTLAEVV